MSRLHNFVSSHRSFACDPSRMIAFLERLGAHRADGFDDMEDDLADAVYPPLPSLQFDPVSGIAVIPICGLIVKGVGDFFARYFGLCDLDTVNDMIDQALTQQGLRAIAFRIDSPGGYTVGVPELAERIAGLTARMPTLAYTETLECSAAYWIGSACGRKAATLSAEVGNIGTYCTLLDSSAAYKEMGLRVLVFRSGAYKAIGTSGTSLTPEQEAFMQADVDATGDDFRSTVSAFRPGIKPEDMQGQWFNGRRALASGMVDAIVPDLSSALSLLR